MIETGTTQLEIHAEFGGCNHDVTVPLGCANHDFEHVVGYACRKCKEQFWATWGCDGKGNGG